MSAVLTDRKVSAGWAGFRAGRSVLLTLPRGLFASMATRQKLAGHILQRKQEFHLTLLNSDQSEAVAAAMKGETHWQQEWAALDWGLFFDHRFWLIRRCNNRGEAEALSIVAMARLPTASEILQRYPQVAPWLENRPWHVTLATWGDEGGIGLASMEQFRQRRVMRLPTWLLTQSRASQFSDS